MRGLPFWPEGASTLSPQVDALFIALVATSGLVLALVFGLMVTFAVRYRRGSDAALPVILAGVLLASFAAVTTLRRQRPVTA